MMINAYMLDPFSYILVDRERESEEKKKESIARKNGKERMENVYNLSLPPEWWGGYFLIFFSQNFFFLSVEL
jgi:hypothetical protein